MSENKIVAAILTIATNARATFGEAEPKEDWRRTIKHYEQILAELDRESVKKTG